MTQMLERMVGRWLHHRLIAAPEAHVALLDQYRGAEEYQKRNPKTICPHLLPQTSLRARYMKHQSDEAVHEQLLADRIREMGGTPMGVPPERDYLSILSTELVKANGGIPPERFDQQEPFGPDELAHFFAFQIVTEERGVVEMEMHRDACARSDPRTHGIFEQILKDERYHVEYSRRAYADVAEPSRQQHVMNLCRRVEAAVYNLTTARFLRHLAENGFGLSGFSRSVLRILARLTHPSGGRSG
jgi:hypothetical protein